MTGNPVSRLYDSLTPRERLLLLIAAAMRGDDVEQQRLQTSAPKLNFELPDYYTHAEAELTNYHLLTLLDFGMHFWQWWGLWLTRGLRNQAAQAPSRDRRGNAKAAKVQENRAGCLVRYYAARFVAHVDGWKQFSTELHVDPAAPLDFMPGWENIVRTEHQMRELAFTPDEALWFVRMETVPEEGDESQESGHRPGGNRNGSRPTVPRAVGEACRPGGRRLRRQALFFAHSRWWRPAFDTLTQASKEQCTR